MAICHSLTDGMPEGGVAMVVADGGGVVGVVGGGRSGLVWPHAEHVTLSSLLQFWRGVRAIRFPSNQRP